MAHIAQLILLLACVFVAVSTSDVLDNIRTKYSSSDLCDLCKLTVEVMDDLLAENSTEQDILNEVKKACPYVTYLWPIQVCEGFIEIYGPSLFQAIIQEETPDRVCDELVICSGELPYDPQSPKAQQFYLARRR